MVRSADGQPEVTGQSGQGGLFAANAAWAQFVLSFGLVGVFLGLGAYLVSVSSARESLLQALQYTGAAGISFTLAIILVVCLVRTPLSVDVASDLRIRSLVGWRAYPWKDLAAVSIVPIRGGAGLRDCHKVVLDFTGRRVTLYERSFDVAEWPHLLQAIAKASQQVGISISDKRVVRRLKLTDQGRQQHREAFTLQHPSLISRIARALVWVALWITTYVAAITYRGNGVLFFALAVASAIALAFVILNTMIVIVVPTRMEVRDSDCRVRSLCRSFALPWSAIRKASIEDDGKPRTLRLISSDHELVIEDADEWCLVDDKFAAQVSRHLEAAGGGVVLEVSRTDHT